MAPPGQTENGAVATMTSGHERDTKRLGREPHQGELAIETIPEQRDERCNCHALGQVQRRDRMHRILRTEEQQRGEREGAPECQARLVDARGDEAGGLSDASGRQTTSLEWTHVAFRPSPSKVECQSLHRSPPHALAESERDRTVDRSHVHDHEGIRHARQAPNPSRHLSHREPSGV